MLATRLIGVLLLTLVNGSAMAATQTPEQRRQVAPLIRALTDCVARQTLADDGGASAFRGNTFSAFVVRKWVLARRAWQS